MFKKSRVLFSSLLAICFNLPFVPYAEAQTKEKLGPLYQVNWTICGSPAQLAQIKIQTSFVKKLQPVNGCYRSATSMIVWADDDYKPTGLLVQILPGTVSNPAIYKIAFKSWGCLSSTDVQKNEFLHTSNWPQIVVEKSLAQNQKTLPIIQFQVKGLNTEQISDLLIAQYQQGKDFLGQTCKPVKL